MSTKSAVTYGFILRLIGSLLLCTLPLLLSGSRTPSLLERIQQQGYLNVLSINGPTTYYEGPFGYTGFEYELAQAFANSLDIQLVVHDVRDPDLLLDSVDNLLGDFAAASLTVTPERQKRVNFTDPYLTITQKVIYRRGEYKPKTVADLIGKDIVVMADSPHSQNLQKLQKQYSALRWREETDSAMLDLMEMVHNGKADITIVDSNAFVSNRNIYPKARAAFDITPPESKAWAFPKIADDTLYNAAQNFIGSYIANGELKTLVEKHYSPDNSADEGDALIFAKRIEQRLPKWKPYFQATAEEFDINWLLLAAISYQESHWNPRAISPTGVRGMMMLTQLAAADVGVTDRTDPIQSIHGGAKYFAYMLERIPDNIAGPDRLWMALAAYNVGYGHLQDARIITRRQGGDPDLWRDVKQRLPLLAKRKYYRHAAHGFARGWEPVAYVDNIRYFYTILAWHEQHGKRRLDAGRRRQKLPSTKVLSVAEEISRRL